MHLPSLAFRPNFSKSWRAMPGDRPNLPRRIGGRKFTLWEVEADTGKAGGAGQTCRYGPFWTDLLGRTRGERDSLVKLHRVDDLYYPRFLQRFEVSVGAVWILEPAPGKVGAQVGQLGADGVLRRNVAEVL